MKRRSLLAMLGLALAGCATPPPPSDDVPVLRLSPASLGRTLSLQQHLRAQFRDRPPVDLLVLLEVDAAEVRLAVLSGGQTVARLAWDGVELRQQRAPGWPDAVDGARVLSDLQLALWPAESVGAALPPGWRFEHRVAGLRRLWRGDELVTTVRQVSAQRLELEQHRVGYRLQIDTLNPETP